MSKSSKFTISQAVAAERYRISARTLRRYTLPFERRGRQIFYRPGDIEAAISKHSIADHNWDQHDAALRSIGRNATPPPGNPLRNLAIMAAGRTLTAIETVLGADAADMDWMAEYGIDSTHAAVVLCRAAILARQAAEGYLASRLDEDFHTEVGQTLDQAMSAMTGNRLAVKSNPAAAAGLFTSEPFATTFQHVADRAAEFLKVKTR
jgi:hypothetical protein